MLCVGALKIFGSLSQCPLLLFPKFLPYKCTRKKLGSPWIRPRSLFPKFFMGYYSDGHWPNLKFVALPMPEIIAIGVLAHARKSLPFAVTNKLGLEN